MSNNPLSPNSSPGRYAEASPLAAHITLLESDTANRVEVEQAFGAIARALSPAISKLAAPKLSNAEDIEDVTQTVLLKAWRIIDTGQFQEDKPIEPWAAVVTRNAINDELRVKYSIPIAAHIEDPDIFDNLVTANAPEQSLDPAELVIEKLSKQEKLREALALLTKLQPVHRTLLLLSACGASQAEIAKAQRLPLGTVKGRFRSAHRALEELKEAA